MQSIFEIDFSSLIQSLNDMGEPPFRGKQIWQGVYQNLFSDWDQFTMLSKDLREKLRNKYSLDDLQLVSQSQSFDKNTQKYLFHLLDGKPIESVLMFSGNRKTICISTQSGCAMGCSFCATGRMGLLRSLSSGEIIEQVVFFQRMLKKTDQFVSNIVLMGMGEPLLNYANLKRGLEIVNGQDGLCVGARHITVSTIGIIPEIIHFAHDFPQINLAVSLHAPTNVLRNKLIPMNKRFPVEQLITTCKEYIKLTNRRISFEYVLLDGENDNIKQAKELVSLLKGLLCHVNLIPFNRVQDSSYSTSSKERTHIFFQTLKEAGIPTTIRQSQGQEINAGCGQLAGSIQ
jgi:23S rRNA (adenine2503-C2)-methyltransferase